MAQEFVKLKLAHPITADQAQRVRAKDVKDYPTPGMDISVPPDEARNLIEAGYAADVDPEDPKAVSKVLGSASPGKSDKS